MSLKPEAKLLFIFLVSNRATQISGYYELTLLEMAMYLGWTPDRIEKLLPKLAPRILYVDGWVIIKNYSKHQNYANNAKVQKGIDRQLNEVPEHVLNLNDNDKYKSETMDSLSIPYQKGQKVDKSGDKSKNMYGEFKNVALTDEEKQKLIDTYGRAEAKALVDELSTGIESKGYKYKSHYATLRNWARRKGLQVIQSKEPKMIPETLENGAVRMVPNPKYHAA